MLHAGKHADMNTFTFQINDLTQTQSWHDVQSFVGTDRSGSFGIFSGHEDFVTCLQAGIARFRKSDAWHYIAQPSGVLLFQKNVLSLSTSKCVISADPDSLEAILEDHWFVQEKARLHSKRNLIQIEQALARKFWEMNRYGG